MSVAVAVVRPVPLRTRALVIVALVVASAIVAVSVVWGWDVQADERVKLGAAPLVGEWRARYSWTLIAAGLIALAVVWFGPRWSREWRFGRVTSASALASTAFTFLLAASDGFDRLLDPVVHPTEYWANLKTLPPMGEMLREYGTIDFLLNYSVHAKGHPPGFFVLQKVLAAIGLGAPWVTGALSYLGVFVVVVAVLAAVRLIAGEDRARAAAPFLVVAPYTMWMGTSADAFYAAVGAVGVLLVAVAFHTSTRRRRIVAAIAAGVVLALGLFFTYGIAIFLLLPVIVTVGIGWKRWREMFEVIAAACVGAAAITATYALAGFWWFDGANTTKTFYWWGTAQYRPANYFAVANLGAALIAIGPAAVVGLALLRDRRLALVAVGGVLCVLAADASQYSKAEVERIWLPFYPWALTAAAVVSRPRVLLVTQSVLAIGLQMFLVSKW